MKTQDLDNNTLNQACSLIIINKQFLCVCFDPFSSESMVRWFKSNIW